jgi:hypothetical protein
VFHRALKINLTEYEINNLVLFQDKEKQYYQGLINNFVIKNVFRNNKKLKSFELEKETKEKLKSLGYIK